MAGEIITLQVGQCGNHIGRQLWSQLSKEHGIDEYGRAEDIEQSNNVAKRDDDLKPFFKEVDYNRYTPRALLFDMEPSEINNVKNQFPDFFDSRNIWVSAAGSGAANSWAKGYDCGVDNQDLFLNMIDREIDSTDNFEGFQLLHSVGGGTGSGMGSNLLEALKDRYPKKLLSTYSVFPGEESEVVVQNYNSILTLKRLIEEADASVVFDNNALLNMTERVFADPNTGYYHTNQLISSTLSAISNSLRFPSYLYNSMTSIFSTLVPSPELHFLIPSFTPFTSDYVEGGKIYKRNTAYEILLDLVDANCSLATCDLENPTYFSVFNTVIGPADHSHVSRALLKIQQRLNFAPKLYSSIHVNIGRRSPYLVNNEQRRKISTSIPRGSLNNAINGMMLANSSAIVSLLEKQRDAFDKVFQRKAFMNMYQDGKLFQNVEDEFLDSRDVVQDLISEYLHAEQENYLDEVMNEEENVVGYGTVDADGDDNVV